MSEVVKVGLLGFGTVGTGVVEVLRNHEEKISHQLGCAVEITKILTKEPEEERPDKPATAILTDDAYSIVRDPEIQVIVEVMGGVDFTKELIVEALKHKKSVVTANKDMLAVYGPELFQLANANGCDIYYEASVAGAIPIIRSMKEGLAADEITRVMGIVNGTTNYILTKMTQDGASYGDVLKEAQDLGFAEANPSADVDGLDAARKMAILASLGFSMEVTLSDVTVEGISNITLQDLKFSKDLGYEMKLVGLADIADGKIEVSVAPTLLPLEHPLANVNGVNNAVYVYSKAIGETMYYGPGAGSLPTGAAVVSDLLTVIRNIRLGSAGEQILHNQFEKKMKTSAETNRKYFIRLKVEDQPGAMKEVVAVFAKYGVSMEKILQTPLKGTEYVDFVVVTHHTTLQNIQDTLEALRNTKIVSKIESAYRIVGEKK